VVQLPTNRIFKTGGLFQYLFNVVYMLQYVILIRTSITSFNKNVQ